MDNVEIVLDSFGNKNYKIDNGDGSFTVYVEEAYKALEAANEATSKQSS